MMNFLNKPDIVIDDVGFAKIENDCPTINHLNENLEGIVPRSYKWSEVMRYFPYFRLYIITEGEMVLTLNNNSTLHMKGGNMYLIHPFSIKKAEKPDHILHYFIHFNILSVPFNFFDYFGATNATEYTDEDISLVKTLLSNYPATTAKTQFKTIGAIQLLLSKFFLESDTFNPDIQKFAPVLKYIEDNICSPITINELADIMHLNKNYFINFFSKTFNMPPLKYIIERRTLLAEKLLIDTNHSISEIAEQLGFTNEYYFSSTFKKTVGLSPIKWRKLYFDKKNI